MPVLNMAWSGNTDSRFVDSATNWNSISPFGIKNKKHFAQLNSGTSTISKLNSLHIGSTAIVIGVVIAKECPKSIYTKKNNGAEKFLVSFVIRDSPACFVNCTCWGSEMYIADLARSFCIGDVVKIENAQVQANYTDGSDEKFRPSTPLAFHLTLSEFHSSLGLYDGIDVGSYDQLRHIPTKASSDYYTLEDVQANGQGLNNEHINLLVAVLKIGPAKEILTKTGKHTMRCEIKLYDESCPSFPLVLWGKELVEYAQSWTSIETVLFIADVRMNYDDFRTCMVATADSKTIFTTNPDSVDAKSLYQFVLTKNFLLEDDDGNGIRDTEDPPLSQITDELVIEQIATREHVKSDHAILNGVITRFDLDADNTEQFFKRRCGMCKKLMSVTNDCQCTNPTCSQFAMTVFGKTGELTVQQPEMEFNLPINISDHTGTIQTRLNGNVLESMTGWKIRDLMQLDPEIRTGIKWNFLLERCKFYIKITKSYGNSERLSVRVISCGRTDTDIPSDG